MGIQDKLKRLSEQQDPDNNIENGGEKIDREKTCPLLLRVFCQTGRHHQPDDFIGNRTPSNELQIYTWKDATLKELMNLVKEVNPDARRRGTVFNFAIIYPNVSRGMYLLKEIGVTCAGEKRADDNVTLQSRRFQIGDFIDIAIYSPRKD